MLKWPAQVLGLLVLGMEREATVSSLLTDTEQCALYKWLQLYRGCVPYRTEETK